VLMLPLVILLRFLRKRITRLRALVLAEYSTL
jgi:hypothetical protein